MRSAVVLILLLLSKTASANPGFALPANLRLAPELEERMNRVLDSVIVFAPQLSPEQQQDLLQYDLRERDRLRFLVGGPTYGSLGYGALIFAATTILVARAPRQVQQVFVGKNRLGPAVLDSGGLGVGAVLSF